MEKISRIFVTGAAGMIGSNISRSLVGSGHQVVGVDNLWRGQKRSIADLLTQENFSFRHADLASDRDWCRDMDRQSVVVHTADIVAGIGYVFANEWSVFQRNLLINTQVARVVNEYLPERLIYLGTVCSYPQSLQRSVSASVLKEMDKMPADPESGYGWSKLMGEIEFRLATKGTPVRFAVLDLHNVYGWPCVYQDATSQVIPSLINKALTSKDRKLNVWGNGEQGRGFLHVSDVVTAVGAAVSYGGSESTFMIGPDRCTTIREVATLIQQHPRIEIDEIIYDSSKPTGDIGRFADARVAGRELQWRQRMEFRDGLYDLIDRIIDDRA